MPNLKFCVYIQISNFSCRNRNKLIEQELRTWFSYNKMRKPYGRIMNFQRKRHCSISWLIHFDNLQLMLALLQALVSIHYNHGASKSDLRSPRKTCRAHLFFVNPWSFLDASWLRKWRSPINDVSHIILWQNIFSQYLILHQTVFLWLSDIQKC